MFGKGKKSGGSWGASSSGGWGGKGKGKGGKGKGKGYGGKGKKAMWATASSSWESDGWGNQGSDWEADGSWGGGDEYGESYTKHTGRLQVKKGFNHAILRGYADPEGTVLYSSDWGGDLEMLKPSSLVNFLTHENSNVHRNPSVGLSCAAASLKSMFDIASKDSARTGLAAAAEKVSKAMDEDADFMKALKVLDTQGKPKAFKAADIQAALTALSKFFKEQRTVVDEIARIAIASSRLFVGSLAFVELATAFGNFEAWASKIPDDIVWDDSLAAWKQDPKNLQKLIAFVSSAFGDKDMSAKAWAGGTNTADAIFQTEEEAAEPAAAEESPQEPPKKKRRKPSSSSSDSSSSTSSSDDKKKKKKAKKDKKKGKKKDKKDKKNKKENEGNEEKDNKANTEEKANNKKEGDNKEEDKKQGVEDDGERANQTEAAASAAATPQKPNPEEEEPKDE